MRQRVLLLSLNNMKKIEDINPADYVKTFESRGTTLLFQDFGTLVYMPNNDWLLVDRAGHEFTYASTQAIADSAKEGEARTLKEAEDARLKLSSYLDEADSIAAKLGSVSPNDLNKRDVEEAYLCVKNICIWYRFFDPFYWETVFEKARAGGANMVESPATVVQAYKNVARERINKVFLNEDGVFLLTVTLISKKFSIKREDLEYYLADETLRLFDDSHFRVATSEIQNRKTLFIMYRFKGGEAIFLTGPEAEAAALKFDTFHHKTPNIDTSEVKGKIAFSNGKVIRGKVKIISREYGSEVDTFRKKMAEMAEGDILVSETTEPDMMEALKKAGAIVTDIGGLLSHAAITARELKTPCVVNTRLATKVFKDGDMVEVDAEKGVVRKV